IGGVPISLVRTFDSMNTGSSGSLGFGWSLSGTQLQFTTDLATTGDESGGLFNPLRQGSRAFVTLPNGRRVGFTFAPTAITLSEGVQLYRPAWITDNSETVTLRSTDTLLQQAGGAFFDASAGLPYNPASSALKGGEAFILTAGDGTQYRYDNSGQL